MTTQHHLQGILGVVLLSIAAGLWDVRAGLAVAGALMFVDYLIQRRGRHAD